MGIRRYLWGTILLLGLGSRSLGQPELGTLVDKIIARVDDQVILQSDVEKEFQLYQAQGGEAPVPGLKCQILEGILINKLLLARALAKGIAIKKAEVESYLNREMQGILSRVGSEAMLERYTGKSIQTFKEELRGLIKERLAIERMRDKIINDISITPTEVQAFFDKLPNDSLPYYSAEVEVRQIVRYPVLSQQDKASIIERLQALKARLQAGEKFEELARQYSEDPGSASSGGELGFWKLGELVPAYEKAALALEPGEISDPVETQFGFHLIQLIERQKDRYNSRHILIKSSASKPDLQGAMAYLDSMRNEVLAGHTTFERAAKECSEDIATAQQGGLLTGTYGGLRIPIDDLPSEVFFIVDKLAPGAISEPIVFTTAIGKQAVRIVYLKEKIPPHQANLQQDYEKIYQMALNAKKATALNEWFRDVKATAIIKVDPAYQDCAILE